MYAQQNEGPLFSSGWQLGGSDLNKRFQVNELIGVREGGSVVSRSIERGIANYGHTQTLSDRYSVTQLDRLRGGGAITTNQMRTLIGVRVQYECSELFETNGAVSHQRSTLEALQVF